LRRSLNIARPRLRPRPKWAQHDLTHQSLRWAQREHRVFLGFLRKIVRKSAHKLNGFNKSDRP
jgi:hypothetical protein